MTRRGRIPDAILALVATWAAILPLRTLFTSLDWVNPALLATVIIVAVGIVGRMLTSARWPVVAAQAAALIGALSGLHLRGHLWYGLPLEDGVRALNNLLYMARMTVVTYAAPAPANRGMIVALTVVIGLIVLAVDALAVTFRSPALAGLPLLAAYLITATNTGEPLAWFAFVLPAGCWLAMVARAGVEGLQRWATAVPLRDGGRRGGDGIDGFATAARNVAVAAVISALVVAWVVPHPSAHFLGDGLGRSASGGGDGGAFELSTTLDLTRSLEDQDDAVVLRYRTSAPSVAPLQISVLGEYTPDGQFLRARTYPAQVIVSGMPITGLPDLSRDPDQVARSTFSVDSSRLSAPQIALPEDVTQLDLPSGVGATRFPDGTIDVSERAEAYSGNYVTVTPTTEQLQASHVRDGAPVMRPGVRPPDTGSLTVEPRAKSRLDAILREIVPGDATDFEAAVAIQDYLRSSRFTYSLTLVDPKDANGRPEKLDPVSRFLETKVGFCQQFATAMIMLARERGIPARMVLGFLPGSLENGVRTIRGSDAHAWPELYFEPYGWLRFEPTPGSRSGTVPSYAHEPVAPGQGSSSSSTSRPPTQRPDIPERQQPGTTASGLDRPIWQRVTDIPSGVWVLLGLLLGGLGVLVVPVSGRLRRSRRLAGARSDAGRIEVRWHDLTERLADLGVVTPESLTPRQAEAFIAERGVLEPESRQAMGRLVATLELARYAPPATTLTDPSEDVDTVVAAVAASRRWPIRLHARILPRGGRQAIGDAMSAVLAVPRRALATGRDVIARLPRRRGR